MSHYSRTQGTCEVKSYRRIQSHWTRPSPKMPKGIAPSILPSRHSPMLPLPSMSQNMKIVRPRSSIATYVETERQYKECIINTRRNKKSYNDNWKKRRIETPHKSGKNTYIDDSSCQSNKKKITSCIGIGNEGAL